jgi:glycosyltransferase involved in cell wall biosynthesis
MALKVVFCWTDISGYMAASWRALAALPEIDLFVIAFQAKTETAFADQVMEGISSHLLDLKNRHDDRHIKTLVNAQNADVIVLNGWFHRPYRHLATATEFRDKAFVLTMDTPWWGTWKQHLAPYLLRPFIRRMAQVVVTGERSWQYAWRLGFSPERIQKGLYGIDFDALSPLWAERRAHWPQSFLYIGRYNSVKGIDVMVQAYRHYYQTVKHPWPLVCCGQGDLAHLLENQPGIKNLGFVQPQQMLSQFSTAGTLVLPSRFDPWPLALVEAAAAGLPILCTEACGSAVELVRQGYNGWTVPSNNIEALSQGFATIQQNYSNLPTWGQRAQVFAAAYSASLWAERWGYQLKALIAAT